MKKSAPAKKSLRIPAFAKINSCLYIIAKRPDGYHELRTIFQTISLRDTLQLTLDKKSDAFTFRFTSDDPAMPLGNDNLVVRAITGFQKEFGLRGSLTVHLEKKIPVARGLGGGSSDAAATLIGLLRLTNASLPLEKIIKLAASLGADVPFFLFGGRAMAVGRGDEIYPLPDQPKRSVVVVSPKGIGVSTKDAYEWASAELTKDSEPHKLFRFCALCWSRQDARLSNDFESPVFRRHPRLEEIRAGLLKRGAADAALAGSGSAVFGIFRNPAQARRSAREFPEDSVFVVETISRSNYGRAMGWRTR
ncbi:MAG TPA: 4-(cytidine 5'-diphospho)-2-C-methyl-D-erythritol kinase [Candidatus Acidoferrales bacterium]